MGNRRKYKLMYDGVDYRMEALIYVESSNRIHGMYLGSSGQHTNIRSTYNDALLSCIQHALNQNISAGGNSQAYFEVKDVWVYYYGYPRYKYTTTTIKGVKKQVIYKDGSQYSVQDLKRISANDYEMYNVDKVDHRYYKGRYPTINDIKEIKHHEKQVQVVERINRGKVARQRMIRDNRKQSAMLQGTYKKRIRTKK